jgi:hypothetical protein
MVVSVVLHSRCAGIVDGGNAWTAGLIGPAISGCDALPHHRPMDNAIANGLVRSR